MRDADTAARADERASGRPSMVLSPSATRGPSVLERKNAVASDQVG